LSLCGRNPAQFTPLEAVGFPAGRFRSPPLRFGEQNRKIFSTFFNRPLAKIFSIKEMKIFLFCLSTDAGIAETLSHPQPRFASAAALGKRKEVKTLVSPSFARVFEILLPLILTFNDSSNIIEI
jgi:hypothetical protein